MFADANAADYRPTYEEGLGEIARKSILEYERGQGFVAGIGSQDVRRCVRLHEIQRENNNFDALLRVHICGEWMIVPAWAKLLEQVKLLKEALQ